MKNLTKLFLAVMFSTFTLTACNDDKSVTGGGSSSFGSWTTLGSPSNTPAAYAITQIGSNQLAYTSAGLYISRSGGS